MGMPTTLLQAVKHFSDPDNCRAYMVARRWPNGVACPRCGSMAVYFDSSSNRWECKTRHPKRKFTLKTGTIFEDSPLGLDKWLPTVWMIANCKNGVSSWEIHRAIGVTQKTAWFMLHRIRLAMQDTETGGKLGGDVEIDETYIGGKARNMHKKRKERAMKGATAGMAGKVAVQGLLERHSKKGHSIVRTLVVKNTRTEQIQTGVRANVEAGSNIYTDSLRSYKGLGPGYNGEYIHNVIDHAEKYVDGQVHTNGLENYWSLLKRALRGTYVAVEPFHLFRYLDEQAFRFNNRFEMNDADRFSLAIYGILGRRLMYQDLIAAGTATEPA